MNDALHRGAWDKGCTDIMYLTIEYPNYPIISLLTQPRGNCVNVLRLRSRYFFMVSIVTHMKVITNMSIE